MAGQYIKSPMNYTGNKYKLLPDLFELFPENINTFVDLFAGGFNVGINAEADTIICNDQIEYIIELYRYMKEHGKTEIIAEIQRLISKYSLSQTNVDGYKSLRADYNEEKDPMKLFVLVCYSFNHQIRFNNNREFNTPFGKERSSYNPSIENNLIAFCDALATKNVVFEQKDFLDLNLSFLGPTDLVYCDPPYLISNGSYNDGKRGFKDWSIKEEKELLGLLDELDKQGTRFVLSNVFYHKGAENDILIEWSKKYSVKYVDKTYSNCSYHFKDRGTKTVEVMVYNY